MQDVWITAPGFVAVASLAALWLYARSTTLRRFFIPPAFIAGAALLLVGPEVANVLPAENYAAWKKWPGYLISFLFAGIILGEKGPDRDAKSGATLNAVFRQAVFVWFIAVSQLALGFLLVSFVIAPLGGEPLMAHIVEIGWIGGHGSAAALTAEARNLGRPAVGDLAVFSATVGLLVGGTVGIVLVNRLRRLYPKLAAASPESSSDASPVAAASPPRAPEGEGEAERSVSLFAAAALLTLCVLAAFVSREGLLAFSGAAFSAETRDFIAEFPLFSVALLWALLLRFVGLRLGLLSDALFSRIKELTAIVLDLLIVSAVATLKLSTFAENLGFFALLMAAATLWCVAVLLFFAERMLPSQNWLELGVLNFGMSAGVTAVGLVLVKSLRGGVSESTARIYGLAAPLSAPLIGGGLISLLLPRLTAQGYLWQLTAATVVFSVLLFLLGTLLRKMEVSRGRARE